MKILGLLGGMSPHGGAAGNRIVFVNLKPLVTVFRVLSRMSMAVCKDKLRNFGL